MLAALAGSTRATCVFFTNFGVAYTCRIIDVPASTGYGEPIQRLFKLKDGERVVAAISLDPRAVGDIDAATTKAPTTAAAGARRGRDERRLRAALRPRAASSSRARAPAAATPGPPTAPRWSASRGSPASEIADRRDARGARPAVPGRRGQLPVRPGQGRDPDQARSEDDRVLGFIASTGDRDLLTVETTPRRRADDQHRQIRSDRPRRQGPRAAAARPVHPHRLADARGAAAAWTAIVDWRVRMMPSPRQMARSVDRCA